MKRKAALIMAIMAAVVVAVAQPMKTEDLEKYAKERYGSKWTKAAQNLASQLVLDKNQSLTYQQVIEAPGKSRNKLYTAINYWATATFLEKGAISLNDKEEGVIILRPTIAGIAEHIGTINKYSVSITPVIRIDIKDNKIRVTTTVQYYDILNILGSGWVGMAVNEKSLDNSISDSKRMKDDKTNERLYDQQWEIAKHFPFVENDDKKRTASKALVMTHAYANAVMDKLEDTVKNGLTGNEDDDW